MRAFQLITAVFLLASPNQTAADPVLEPISGSYFEFVPGHVTWREARILAAQREFQGRVGHLATPATPFEDALLVDLAASDSIGWLGATNRGMRGNWFWAAGPLANSQFAELSSREELRALSHTSWIDMEQASEPVDGERFVILEKPAGPGKSGWWSSVSNVNVDGYWVEYSPASKPIYSTTTGGYIEFVPSEGISWQDAKASAESRSLDGLPGQLATVATFSETAFMRQFFPDVGQAWLGAADIDGDGAWQWAGLGPEQDIFWNNGRVLSYHNWEDGQPEGSNGESLYATWNSDEDGAWSAANESQNIDGYFVEYIPELPSPNPTIRRVYNPENGHVYQIFRTPAAGWDRSDFFASQQYLDGVRGHLVTITSSEEQEFIDEVLGAKDIIGWIGASDADVEGEWRWVAGPETGNLFWNGDPSGEAIGFENWGNGEPNDLSIEDHAGNAWFGPFWNDFPIWWGVGDMIVEYSFVPGDADHDGDVDLADFNTLKENFGGVDGGGPSQGNFDFIISDAVDLEDFTILKNNFGAGSTAAPEPGGLLLMAFGALLFPVVLRRGLLPFGGS